MQSSIAIKAESTTGDCWASLLQVSSIPFTPMLIQNEVIIVPPLVELPSDLSSAIDVLEVAGDGVLTHASHQRRPMFKDAGAKALRVRLF
jgi:hypothetical protein